jgi:hypothetical protein
LAAHRTSSQQREEMCPIHLERTRFSWLGGEESVSLFWDEGSSSKVLKLQRGKLGILRHMSDALISRESAHLKVSRLNDIGGRGQLYVFSSEVTNGKQLLLPGTGFTSSFPKGKWFLYGGFSSLRKNLISRRIDSNDISFNHHLIARNELNGQLIC